MESSLEHQNHFWGCSEAIQIFQITLHLPSLHRSSPEGRPPAAAGPIFPNIPFATDAFEAALPADLDIPCQINTRWALAHINPPREGESSLLFAFPSNTLPITKAFQADPST